MAAVLKTMNKRTLRRVIMIIGYIRVSTEKQNFNIQQDALAAFGCDKIYEEKISGTKNKDTLDMIKNEVLRPGDTFVVYKMDRLSRTALQIMLFIHELYEREINIVSLSEDIDLSTPSGRFLAGTFANLIEYGKDNIVENTKAGIKSARARGRTGGRKPMDEDKIKLAVTMYNSKQYTIPEICKTVPIARTVLYKYLKDTKYNN